MVAAHAYDLRAAKKTYVSTTRDIHKGLQGLGFNECNDLLTYNRGMETIYIRRWTEDGLEFVTGDEQVRKESDMYIDGRETTSESGGLLELVQVLET